jgi:hypothetical protein
VKIRLSEARFHVTTGLDRFQEGFLWRHGSFYGVGENKYRHPQMPKNTYNGKYARRNELKFSGLGSTGR